MTKHSPVDIDAGILFSYLPRSTRVYQEILSVETVAPQKLLLDFRSWFPPRKITFLVRTFFDFLFPTSVLYSELRKQCADQIRQSAQVSSHQFFIPFHFELKRITVASSRNTLALRARMFFYSIQFTGVYSWFQFIQLNRILNI